jgi:hypothetical protein
MVNVLHKVFLDDKKRVDIDL